MNYKTQFPQIADTHTRTAVCNPVFYDPEDGDLGYSGGNTICENVNCTVDNDDAIRPTGRGSQGEDDLP